MDYKALKGREGVLLVYMGLITYAYCRYSIFTELMDSLGTNLRKYKSIPRFKARNISRIVWF